MIRPKTKAGLGRIFENWALGGGGGAVQYWGAQIFFQPTLMEIFFFFLEGPGPPQAITWLRPCKASGRICSSGGERCQNKNELSCITIVNGNKKALLVETTCMSTCSLSMFTRSHAHVNEISISLSLSYLCYLFFTFFI